MSQDGTIHNPPPPGADELKAVRNIVSLFLTAMKNYSLYPADHNITQKFLKNVKAGLDVFLSEYGSLRFIVAKDVLLYKDQPVHEERAGEEFTRSLFRDGIIWLEFIEGIALDEIVAFFQVVHTYREQREDAGGDVVTALWDLSLPHLLYDATDVLWANEGILNLHSINRGSDYSCRKITEAKDETALPPFEEMAAKVDEATPCLLTDTEEKTLRAMVLAEENKETNEGALDILLIILQDQREQGDFEIALSFLHEEFFTAFAYDELEDALNLLENLRVLIMTSQNDYPWAVVLLEKFFLDISSAEAVSAIYKMLPGLDIRNQYRIDLLSKVLALLDPCAIVSLAQLLVQVSSPVIKQLLLDTIESLAGRDLHPLEKILKSGDDTIVEMLVPILGRLPGAHAGQVLHKLIRHKSEKIRRAAVRVFIQGEGREVREVFPLTDDDSSVIREMAYRFLCRERNALAAKLLMGYLEKSRSRMVDSSRIILAFEALGLSGDVNCLPFLQKLLLGQGWNWFYGFGKPLFRHGAVVALRGLGLPEAEATLARAASSFFPVVRSAVKSAKV